MSKRISASTFKFATLTDLLRWRATEQPEQRIYTFLTDGEIEKEHFTHAALDRQARAIGASLQKFASQGERALLIYPSGLEFIAAFYGCLYSGIIAVPVYPPSAVRSDRTLTKFRAIAQDAQPRVILTAASLLSRVEGLLAQSPELSEATLVVTDELSEGLANDWCAPTTDSETLAFLQYTSGSTGTPKGVMVTHGNLLHNSSLVERYCQHPDHGHTVTWLPLYHDLGLIGGILQPLYAGFGSTIMAPTAFLQRPIRWLQAITKYKGTISGGPNFAYDLCARKITEEQKKALDLSSWEIAANGAEPVRADTMERFAAAFASCGFRRGQSYPSYGMAEATLVISAGVKDVFPTVKTFDARGLEKNEAIETSIADEKDTRTIVGHGRSFEDQQVLVVDPASRRVCPEKHVGEIWVAGPSVAKGYWNKPAETEYTFNAYLADSGEGPFLRTGDLGFIDSSELFITGRLKDLIIIRGGNHYPQDIEQTVESAHAFARSAGTAAFSVEVSGEERLIVVQEVERTALAKNLDEMIAAIRQAIAEQHEIQVYAIVLIKPGSLPKTSSGKVQRRGSREAYLEQSLAIVREWRQDDASLKIEETVTVSASSIPASPYTQANQPDMNLITPTSRIGDQKSVREIVDWLVEHVAQELQLQPGDINSTTPFAQYGMDSAHAVILAGDLEDWLERKLPPTLVYDYPSIEALARHLSNDEAIFTGNVSDPDPASGFDIQAQATGSVNKSASANDQDAIAIIGLGCRFPGANNPDEFWQMLCNEVDGITEVPSRRWDLQQYYSPDRALPGKMNTRWGGFIEQVEQFDPYFFSIAPREAMRMDPQQRLLLEVAWETLEYAGVAPQQLAGSATGVFVGISSNDYSQLQYRNLNNIDAYAGTGNAHSIAANRLSYVFDLRGPSVALDTACSSSLLAVHQACQSLRNGECEAALAGGVNLILTPDLTVAFSQARMMSSSGRCRTFDEEADGYVRGEGCGLILLKPLSAAQRDGDQVLAVIRGSAVNQDGRSNGLTAPNGPSQEAVIRKALSNARVTADQISYVETHGSSTPLGDPIEVDALKAVLLEKRDADQVCLLGSVKTNIGHLEAAAGIAGLIKTILSLQHGEIAPNLHFQKLNSHISLAGTPFKVATERQSWPAVKRRLAGVSAFGFGGTNVHVVLEAAPTAAVIDEHAQKERVPQLVTLSARSESALQQMAQRYIAYLKSHPTASLSDISSTVNGGRALFTHRLAVLVENTADLQEKLESFVQGNTAADVLSAIVPSRGQSRLAFLFTGQGSQYRGMARELFATQPVFRRTLEHCDHILRQYLEQPLLSVIYPAEGEFSPLDETAYTQPALFALEYALAQLWQTWGIQPDIVMGHSVGEYVAACLAGAFSLEDALKLIATRGNLMQSLPRNGKMAVIFAAPEQIEPVLADFKQVSIAAINGPHNTVISGLESEVETIVQRLEAAGLKIHPMTVSHAFHSPLMEPMLDTFEQVARTVSYQPLSLPLVSNLTGEILAAGTILDASYWCRHIRAAVQFAASMQTLANQGYDLFLELGPTATLTNMGKRCLTEQKASWLISLREGQNDWHKLLQSVATLFTKGYEINWTALYQDIHARRLALPTYPFEREYCWFDTVEQTPSTSEEQTNGHLSPDVAHGSNHQPEQPAPDRTTPEQKKRRHPLLDTYTALIQPGNIHVWESELNTQLLPYLNDHRIQGSVALPVSVYIEMAQAAAVEALGTGEMVLTALDLKKLLLVPEQGSQKVQVVLTADVQEQLSFHVYSHAAGVPDQPRHSWTLHATGKIHHRHI